MWVGLLVSRHHKLQVHIWFWQATAKNYTILLGISVIVVIVTIFNYQIASEKDYMGSLQSLLSHEERRPIYLVKPIEDNVLVSWFHQLRWQWLWAVTWFHCLREILSGDLPATQQATSISYRLYRGLLRVAYFPSHFLTCIPVCMYFALNPLCSMNVGYSLLICAYPYT